MYVPVYTRCYVPDEWIDYATFDPHGVAVAGVPGDLSVLFESVMDEHFTEDNWFDPVCMVFRDGRILGDPQAMESRKWFTQIVEPRYDSMVMMARSSVAEGLNMLLVNLGYPDLDAADIEITLAHFDTIFDAVKPSCNPYAFMKLSGMAYACRYVTVYPFSEYLGAFEYWSALDLTTYQSDDGIEAIVLWSVHV